MSRLLPWRRAERRLAARATAELVAELAAAVAPARRFWVDERWARTVEQVRTAGLHS